MQLGLIKHYIPWLTLPNMAMNLVIIADIWHTMPLVALILQAALAAIPEEMEEAASVDGANAWQRFWKIRLPLLRPAILVALIIRTVEAFRVFDIVYIITSGGPAYQDRHDHLFDLPVFISLRETGDWRCFVLHDIALSLSSWHLSIFVFCTARRRPNNDYRKIIRKLILLVFTIPVLLFIFLPILWLFSASFPPRWSYFPFRPIGSRSTPPCRIIWTFSSPASLPPPFRAPSPSPC